MTRELQQNLLLPILSLTRISDDDAVPILVVIPCLTVSAFLQSAATPDPENERLLARVLRDSHTVVERGSAPARFNPGVAP